MDANLKNFVVAMVTLRGDRVGGAAPTFVAGDQKELESIATVLARVMDGVVHAVDNSTLIVVKH